MAIWAIGDVHGCLGKLRRLWAEIAPGPRDTVVLLGDLIDRGPDPAGVLRFVVEHRHTTRLLVLRGNHEAMCLAWLRHPTSMGWRLWMANGGYTTLESYGLIPSDDPRAVQLPPAHRELLEGTLLWHREQDVVFVHAGLRPGVPLEEQDPEDLVWIRHEFYGHPEAFEHRVVFGHTPFPTVFRRGPLVGIDTGAVYGDRDPRFGRLTAYEPFEDRVVQVE